ncbi:MAG: alcohol dehydrogenase catalytic domain-containing protein [Acidimicrobiales bacterium]|nr:alcohol dehydrogenase catalytic domain-containing protein [Acidimicrobiales bacterium]
MRAVRNTERGIAVVTAPGEPPDGAAGRVSVHVASSGICGTDLHLVSFGPSPVTLGHEFAGRLADGTPVAVLPVEHCGRCSRCRAGAVQQCTEAVSAMYGVSRDGGMAEVAWVDPGCARPLPGRLGIEDACLVEPLAVALHGIHRAGVSAGMRVLVIGAGPIGLCAVAGLRAAGMSPDVQAHGAERQAAALRLGASPEVGVDYDVVLDAAGTQRSLDDAVRLVRPGGTVGILSSFWSPVGIGLGLLMKEVVLVPAFTYGHHEGRSEFDEAAALLAQTPEIAATLITHRFDLSDAAEAFRVAADRGTGAIKVVLVP